MIANWYLYGNYSLSEVSYRVIDLCWEMEKSRDWGVGWESSLVSRTRILLPEANHLVMYSPIARATPIRRLVMKVPMTAILSFLPAPFKPLISISPTVAVSSGWTVFPYLSHRFCFLFMIAPAGFWPRGQNPRRHPRSPRVYTYRNKEYLLKK